MNVLYKSVMGVSAPALRSILKKRVRQGKEDPVRLAERMGVPSASRPVEKPLIWFHAASVGEAQSTLILIQALHKTYEDAHFLVTTGTITSAELMRKRLPHYATHQYYPLDHPQWVANFLDHWSPDAVIWMESELWPCMISEIKLRNIPAALVNARLSERSLKRWKMAKTSAKELLSTFSAFLAQTDADKQAFEELGAENVTITDNLKYSADPLPYDAAALSHLKEAIGERPVWLYASTHKGEEELACRLHQQLERQHPDLLTIIVPRHPERAEAIIKTCENHDLKVSLRAQNHTLPQNTDNVYVANTLGELGLFYRLSPIACIGRSFSYDGGGGHNPIEAAQLECAVIHGPHVQNLAQIFEEMNQDGAALRLKDELDFHQRLEKLLTDAEGLEALQRKAESFVAKKAVVLDRVLAILTDVFDDSLSTYYEDRECA